MDTRFTAALRNLAQNYYQRHIAFAEYRAQRKKIIAEMDREFNGSAYNAQHDITQNKFN
jgi:hypothetical protein